MDFWPWQRVERCFWTKLASFRSISKPKCCGPSRRKIRPVGSTRRVPINVRILAATNRDLEQAVMQGEFRRDLYFRLNVLSLRIPALRERRQDIPLLIGYFLDRMTRTSGLEKILSDDALKSMLAYDWPGSVRELENC